MRRETHNHIVPAVLIHPGEILKDELDARGMTQKELAEKTNRPQQTISLIINGRKGISEETAVDLEEAFDGQLTAEFWINLDANYRLHRERTKRQERKAG
ncbi:MAG: HigA family addiction module antitoxin [Armatimonadota bacterium]